MIHKLCIIVHAKIVCGLLVELRLDVELGRRTRRRWNVIICQSAGRTQSDQDVHDNCYDVHCILGAVPTVQVGNGIQSGGVR